MSSTALLFAMAGYLLGWYARGWIAEFAEERRLEAEDHRARARAFAQQQDRLALAVADEDPRGHGSTVAEQVELGHTLVDLQLVEPQVERRMAGLESLRKTAQALAASADYNAQALRTRPLRFAISNLAIRVKGWWRRG